MTNSCTPSPHTTGSLSRTSPGVHVSSFGVDPAIWNKIWVVSPGVVYERLQPMRPAGRRSRPKGLIGWLVIVDLR
jgi:hypothetical protein